MDLREKIKILISEYVGMIKYISSLEQITLEDKATCDACTMVYNLVLRDLKIVLGEEC